MPISNKSKLEMRNQNYKQNEKKRRKEMNGRETVKKTVANESADMKISYPVL